MSYHHGHGAGLLLGVGALAALGTVAAVSSMNRNDDCYYEDTHCHDSHHCSGDCCAVRFLSCEAVLRGWRRVSGVLHTVLRTVSRV